MNPNEENSVLIPYPQVNVVLQDLLKNVNRILDGHLAVCIIGLLWFRISRICKSNEETTPKNLVNNFTFT